MAQVVQGRPSRHASVMPMAPKVEPITMEQEKASVKNTTVSRAEDTSEDRKGGIHQARRRIRSKISTSRSWARRKASPEAIAMRGVAKKADRVTAAINPAYTTFRVSRAPKWRFVRSVIRNANG